MSRAGAETLVLEEDGEIRAFLVMDVDRNRKMATMVTLDVHERTSAEGIRIEPAGAFGADSLNEASATYKLQVDIQNEGAIAFYRKNGFEVERLLRKYYPGSRDAWQMVKKLPTSGGK